MAVGPIVESEGLIRMNMKYNYIKKHINNYFVLLNFK